MKARAAYECFKYSVSGMAPVRQMQRPNFFKKRESHDVEQLRRVMLEGLKNYDTSRTIVFVCCEKDKIGNAIEKKVYLNYFHRLLIRDNLLKLAAKKVNEVQADNPDKEYEHVSRLRLYSDFEKDHGPEIKELVQTMVMYSLKQKSLR